MSKLLVPFVLLVVVVGASIVSDRPYPRADFVFSNFMEVNTLDPQRMSWMHDIRTARLVYEPLVHYDVLSDGFEIIPGVARAWERSDDGRTYTFHLRPDARWSNGAVVTAEHFRRSWRRAMLPDLVSDYVKFFLHIDGAQDFYDWRQAELDAMAEGTSRYADGYELWNATLAEFDERVAIAAPDDHTLVVTLKRPVPYFLDLAAFVVLAPVYPPLVERYEQPDPATGRLQRRNGWTKPGEIVSNGPFVPVQWRFRRNMRLEQNPHYWNKDQIAIRSIDIVSIDDPNTAVLAYETGAIDYGPAITATYRADMISDKKAFYADHAELVAELNAQGHEFFELDRRLPQDRRKHIHPIPSFGTYFYNFNCSPQLPDGRDNPFTDARVRRAFAMTVDKTAIVEQVMRNGEIAAGALIPPGSIGGYESPAGLRSIGDAAGEAERTAIVVEARDLLEQAGFPDDFTVEILFNKDAGHDLIAQAVAKNWQRYLDVEVLLNQKELKIFREDLKNHNFMIGRAGWFGDYGDPTTYLDINRTGNGNNDRKYSNPVYDGLLVRAETETDPQARLALLAEAERMLVEDELPLVPIYHYVLVHLFDPERITGISSHPRSVQNLFLVDVLGDGIGPDEPRPMRPARPRPDPAHAPTAPGSDA